MTWSLGKGRNVCCAVVNSYNGWISIRTETPGGEGGGINGEKHSKLDPGAP